MAADLQKIPANQFFTELVKAHSELDNVVKAVSSGILWVVAFGGILTVRLDQFYGTAECPPSVRGAVTAFGHPLPPLPSKGTSSITFATESGATCALDIYDAAGLLLNPRVSKIGRDAGLKGTFSGTWVRVDDSGPS